MEGQKGTDARHVLPAIIVDASFTVVSGARARGVQEANVSFVDERREEIGLKMVWDGLNDILRVRFGRFVFEE